MDIFLEGGDLAKGVYFRPTKIQKKRITTLVSKHGSNQSIVIRMLIDAGLKALAR